MENTPKKLTRLDLVGIKDADEYFRKKEEWIAQDNASIAKQDRRGRLTAARKMGRSEGRMEVKKSAVERGWRKKMDIEDIAVISGLTVEEVNRIIDDLKKNEEGQMKNSPRKLIRFDWAIKSLLRDSANFDILEGCLAALLEDESIEIIELLGEEGQQADEDEKFNRVDILVKDQYDRRIIIEVQTTRESDYLERLLFGTSKSIVELIGLGKPYKDIHKVISISILFFNLGLGDDYLYHGRTSFIGMNDSKPLIIKRKEEQAIHGEKVIQFKEKNIFPEYYLIRVEKYPNIVRKKIDEWIYLIKNNKVKEGSTSKNIDKAAEKLDYLNMSDAERKIYERYLVNLHREKDIIDTAKEDEKKDIAKNLLRMGRLGNR